MNTVHAPRVCVCVLVCCRLRD